MIKAIRRLPAIMLLGWLTLPLTAFAQAEAALPALVAQPAERVAYADQADMLAVTHAKGRLVAVGAHGIIMLSDDGGVHFRQARYVPVNVTLTAVDFVDDHDGWAVGNWGVVLATHDGGETWSSQRQETSVDRPLFTVHFLNASKGWAGGLWSLLLETHDGGAHWAPVHLPKPPGSGQSDVNLYDLFAGASGRLYIAAEQGKLLCSADQGVTWTYLETGYSGSFWTGLTLRNGTILIAGLRGTIYRSDDAGKSWKKSETRTQSSLTGLVQLSDGSVVASALDGVSLHSRDDGVSFAPTQRQDRVPLNAVVSPDGQKIVFMSEGGVVYPAAPPVTN